MTAMVPVAPLVALAQARTLSQGQKAIEGHTYTAVNESLLKLATELPRWAPDHMHTGCMHIITYHDVPFEESDVALQYTVRHYQLNTKSNGWRWLTITHWMLIPAVCSRNSTAPTRRGAPDSH